MIKIECKMQWQLTNGRCSKLVQMTWWRHAACFTKTKKQKPSRRHQLEAAHLQQTLYADRDSRPIFAPPPNFLGSTPPIVFAVRGTENLRLNWPITVYSRSFKNWFTPNFNDVDLQYAYIVHTLWKSGRGLTYTGRSIGQNCGFWGFFVKV